MCGIAGIINFESAKVEMMKEELLRVQRHRGPDASGFFRHNNVFLFHNRLSILDLSANSNQPFVSACGKYVIVYNGEVYNYRELAGELQKNGFTLRTTSDTEVILELFVRYGQSMVSRLSGMFAFAILSLETGEVWLFRDRMGIKPLFYFKSGNRIAFSSELKFLKSLVKSELSLNYNSIGQFLHLGFIPAPNTVYNEISKLDTGGQMRISESGTELTTYVTLADNLKEKTSAKLDENINELDGLLRNSVKHHLISDVPVGIFLSGGVDSSLIAALAASHSNGQRVNTFTVGTTVKEFDETDYARKIAAHLGTTHHELIVSPNEAMRMLNTAIDLYDEPFADSSSIPTLLVSQLAGKTVKVCLSGEGSDELFGGYGAYRWAKRLDSWYMKNFRHSMARAFSLSANPRYKKAATILRFDDRNSLPSHIFSQEQSLFSVAEVASLMNFEPWFNAQRLKSDSLRKKRNLSLFEDQSFYDLSCYLPDDLLVKVDRASMYCSLEVRVPYLDNNIVSFATNLAENNKINGKTHKYILRQVLYKWLPKDFFNRPKQGFSIPLSDWLSNELSYLIDENLSPDILSRYGVIQNHNQVYHLVERYRKGEKELYNRLWSLIVLHRWLAQN